MPVPKPGPTIPALQSRPCNSDAGKSLARTTPAVITLRELSAAKTCLWQPGGAKAGDCKQASGLWLIAGLTSAF